MLPFGVTGRVEDQEPADLLRDAGSRHAWPACPLVAPGGQAGQSGTAALAVSHFCSILPKCQTDRATAQVSTNTPTTTKPALLMSKLPMNVQNRPPRRYSCSMRPRISTVPMKKATNTDSPVMVRL